MHHALPAPLPLSASCLCDKFTRSPPRPRCLAAGHMRAAYANLQPDACVEAAARLRRGLEQLVRHCETARSAGRPALPLP